MSLFRLSRGVWLIASSARQTYEAGLQPNFYLVELNAYPVTIFYTKLHGANRYFQASGIIMLTKINQLFVLCSFLALLNILAAKPANAEISDLCQPGYPGHGSVWLAQGYLVPKGIASVNLDTGNVSLITQSPLVLKGDGSYDELNSVTSDPVNTLTYYTRNARSFTNRSLYAYDWVADVHMLVEEDVLTLIGYPFDPPVIGYNTTFEDQTPWGIGSAASSLIRTPEGIKLYLGIERAMNPHLLNQTTKTRRTMIIEFEVADDGKSLTSGRIIADLGAYNPPPSRSDPRDYGDILITPGDGLFAIVGNHFLFPDTLTTVPAAYVPTPYDPSFVTDLYFNAVGNDPSEWFFGAYGQAARGWDNKYWLIDALVDFGDAEIFEDNIYVSFAQSWDDNGLNPSTFRELRLDDGSPFPGLSINDAGDCVPATGQIGVLVWFDDNRDGIFDAGEWGVPDLVTELFADTNGNGILDEGDILLTTTTTADGGLYLFNNLPPGNYVVKVNTTADIATTGATIIEDGHTLFSNLGIGEFDTTVNFGFAFLTPTGVRTPGFWKNHPGDWPVEEITIGDQTYSKTQAIEIMKRATKRNLWTVMFMHVVSAELNLLAGVLEYCGSEVDDVVQWVDDGKDWLAANRDSQPIPANHDAWTDEAESIKDSLDAFNNGELGLNCAPASD